MSIVCNRKWRVVGWGICGAIVIGTLFPALPRAIKNASPIVPPLSGTDDSLLKALQNNDFRGVKLAVANGADVNVRNPDRGWNCRGPVQARKTPLMYAVTPTVRKNYGRVRAPANLELVEFLLNKGANPNYRSGVGFTPLGLAAHSGDLKLLDLLISHGAAPDILNSSGDSAFIDACYSRQLEVAQLLQQNGSDINLKGFLGFTALHRSLSDRSPANKSLKITKWLLSIGADSDVQNKFGETALHCAVKDGNVAAVKLLVTSGTDLSLKDDKGVTGYDIARQYAPAELAAATTQTANS